MLNVHDGASLQVAARLLLSRVTEAQFDGMFTVCSRGTAIAAHSEVIKLPVAGSAEACSTAIGGYQALVRHARGQARLLQPHQTVAVLEALAAGAVNVDNSTAGECAHRLFSVLHSHVRISFQGTFCCGEAHVICILSRLSTVRQSGASTTQWTTKQTGVSVCEDCFVRRVATGPAVGPPPFICAPADVTTSFWGPQVLCRLRTTSRASWRRWTATGGISRRRSGNAVPWRCMKYGARGPRHARVLLRCKAVLC